MKGWTESALNEKQSKGHIAGWTVTGEQAQKKGKYGNKKVVIDSIQFDSKKEAARYLVLRMMQNAGLISELKLQIPFVLIEPNGKERGCKYIADFQYIENGELIIEDVKSSFTRKLPVYKMKRKLMLEKNNISIRET